MSVCSFLTVCFRGIRHMRVRGHRHPFRTASSDTVILTVRPSYMLTSALLQIDTYPALENFSPLIRDWSARPGTMSTVRAGSRTGWCSFANLDPGVLCPVANVVWSCLRPGRIAQGIPDVVKGTNTIFFIDKVDVPAEQWKDVTYGRVVVDYRP